jgi:uracil-DNA glycosylase
LRDIDESRRNARCSRACLNVHKFRIAATEREREETMAWRRKDEDATTPAQSPAISARSSLTQLRAAARRCRACPLWERATQTVFGEGPVHAHDLLIGEQPGDKEDFAGRPFVGPAGQLLDRALFDAGIGRDSVYLTNVVKHFKFRLRGKRRMHARASAAEQAACRFWLDAELARIKPARIVCLGAMAARAILGRNFRLLRERGSWRELDSGARAFATVHPSYLLRLRDAAERDEAYRRFVADLRLLRGL